MTLAFLRAVVRYGAFPAAVTGHTAKSRVQPIIARQALVALLSCHVRFAITQSSFQMADARKGAIFMAVTGSAVFGSHCVSIEAICTPLTVGTVCVPQALQAFPGDRVTVASLQGINIATAVAWYTGSPWHSWVSIVTICTSLTPGS